MADLVNTSEIPWTALEALNAQQIHALAASSARLARDDNMAGAPIVGSFDRALLAATDYLDTAARIAHGGADRPNPHLGHVLAGILIALRQQKERHRHAPGPHWEQVELELRLARTYSAITAQEIPQTRAASSSTDPRPARDCSMSTHRTEKENHEPPTNHGRAPGSALAGPQEREPAMIEKSSELIGSIISELGRLDIDLGDVTATPGGLSINFPPHRPATEPLLEGIRRIPGVRSVTPNPAAGSAPPDYWYQVTVQTG